MVLCRSTPASYFSNTRAQIQIKSGNQISLRSFILFLQQAGHLFVLVKDLITTFSNRILLQQIEYFRSVVWTLDKLSINFKSDSHTCVIHYALSQWRDSTTVVQAGLKIRLASTGLEELERGRKRKMQQLITTQAPMGREFPSVSFSQDEKKIGCSSRVLRTAREWLRVLDT